MSRKLLVIALVVTALVACRQDPGKGAVLGTLEWDRLELTADAAEPVTEWLVKEGQAVVAGQPLLKLDQRRVQADVDAQSAELARLAAVLAEQRVGPRREEILDGEAKVRRAESVRLNTQQDRVRAQLMRQKGMIAVAEVDRAEGLEKAAAADLDSARANLLALKNGTRAEQIAQGEAARNAAAAHLQQLSVSLERLTVRAPRAGRVDSLPMKVGDMPAKGAVVAVMLAGDRPYARVYVPERVRAIVREGDHYQVKVEGYEHPFAAHVRHLESQSTFTPYYALTGDDASRLTYLAELTLDDDSALALPAGLPVQAYRDDESSATAKVPGK